MIAPCKDCPERYQGCHATCEKYREFYEQNKQRLKERSEENIVNDYFGDRKIKTARVFIKKPGRM